MHTDVGAKAGSWGDACVSQAAALSVCLSVCLHVPFCAKMDADYNCKHLLQALLLTAYEKMLVAEPDNAALREAVDALLAR